MSMKKEHSIILLLSIICLVNVLHGQQFRQWGSLEPGPYAVGYKVIQKNDFSRSFGTRSDPANRVTLDEHPRPLQISLWYPALNSDSSTRMVYEEYVEWIGLIGKHHSPTNETGKSGKDEFYSYFTRQGVVKEKLDQLLTMRTAVTKNCVPEKGLYPLILFAPGIGDSPVMHTIICEYLASHGYIVACAPSMGWTSREMTPTSVCIETQARDLEYIIEFMHEYPNVDVHRTGVVGFSLGSCPALILAMRNIDIDAMVSLDGSIGFNDRLALVQESPFYNPKNVCIPLMHINVMGNKRNDLSIIDSLKYSLRTIVSIRGIGHVNFTSIGMIAGVLPGFWKSIEQNAKIGYETLCTYTLHFLDAYIKEEKKDLKFLQNSSEENNLPAGFVSIRVEKPNPTRVH